MNALKNLKDRSYYEIKDSTHCSRSYFQYVSSACKYEAQSLQVPILYDVFCTRATYSVQVSRPGFVSCLAYPDYFSVEIKEITKEEYKSAIEEIRKSI